MPDQFNLDVGQSVISDSGTWYRNLQHLGAGGNAVTFLMVATSGKHRGVPFAVKVFRLLSKPERRESFLEEMQFLQTVDHPSVMRIFDTGVYQHKHPFFVAEYLPHTLHAKMRSGPISVVEKISYSLQLFSALAYISSLDPPIIHRDIQPKNIFIKGRSCVLGDFGLLKREGVDVDEDREIFKESFGAGMPTRYRTPAQVAYLNQQSAITCKSDVFQRGLVLAEMFTGWNPQKPAQNLEDPVEMNALRNIPGSLSGFIANVINRMFQEAADEREASESFLAPWEGIFKVAVERAHALEGRAI